MLFLARTGWFRLVGPIFPFDLIRTARRGSYLIIRLLYPLLVFVLLLLVFAITHLAQTDSQKSSADFCVAFFAVYMLFNLLAVYLLTPAYAAGALAEEKKHQTLDALLASDLRDREIVLGTYLSRITKLGLIFLSPLPIFSFLQLLGGLEPLLIVAGFAFTAISICSLAAVSIFFSVRAENPREALVRTYATTVVLIFVLTAFWGLVQSVPAWRGFPGTDSSPSVVSLEDLARWINLGNPVVLALELIRGIAFGSTLDKLLPTFLGGYAAVHACITVCALGYAVWFLRRFALGDDSGASNKHQNQWLFKQWLRTHWSALPWLSNRPMLWKELLVERILRRGWLRRVFVGLGLVALLSPIIHLTYFFRGSVFPVEYVRQTELVNIWLRLLCGVFGTIGLVQTLAAATGGIAGERDKQTLEELLATPLTNRAIFFAKWQGAICRSSAAWKALLGLWCVGFWTGSIHPAGAAAFLICWLSYAAFLSSLGLWFSVVCRTTRRATAGAFLTLSMLVGCTLLCAYNLGERYLPIFEANSLIPIFTLIYMNFTPMEWTHWRLDEIQFRPVLHVVALAFWWISAWGVYLAARSRFGVITGRIEGDLEATSPPASFDDHKSAWDSAIDSRTPGRGVSWSRAGRLCKQSALAALPILPVLVLVGWYELRARNAEESVRSSLTNLDCVEPGWREYVPSTKTNCTVVWSPILRSVATHLDSVVAPRGEAMQAAADANPGAGISVLTLPQTPKWLDNDYEAVLRAEYPDQERLPPNVVRAIGEHYQAASATIKEAHQLGTNKAVERPAADEDPALICDGDWWMIDRLLVTDAYQQISERRYHEGLESCRALLELARARGTNSDAAFMTFGWSQQNSCFDTALKLIARILAQGESNEADLKEIQSLLAKHDQPTLGKMLRKERARMLWLLANQTGTPELLSVPFIHEMNAWWDQKYHGVPRIPELEELMFYSTLDCLDTQRWAIFQLLTDCIDGTSTVLSAPPAPVWAKRTGSQLDYYQRGMEQSALYFATVRCQLRATVVALALERYRLAHGSWPSALDELTPSYLESIPVGSFDGKPLNYKRVKDGVVVYAVGADRIDRGGTFARNRWFIGRTDIGVRLWNPASRNAPATIPAKP